MPVEVIFNPLPVQFKSLLHWQEGCVFFSGHLNVRTCLYVLVRLARQATFKSSTFWYFRARKGLNCTPLKRGHAVVQLVKALRYKLEGHGIDS
jgi:hypothetical protein